MSETNLIASMQSFKPFKCPDWSKRLEKDERQQKQPSLDKCVPRLLFFVPEEGWFSLLSVLSDFRQCKFVDLAKLLVLDG